MGDPVVAGVDFVGDVQIPTIASASLTAACGQILNTVGSAAASARSRSANVDGDPIVDRHQDDDVGPSVAAIIQSRVTPGIPVNGVRTGRWRRSRRSGKVSSGPGLVAVCLCWSGRCGQAPQLDDLLGRVMSSLPRMWRWETVSSVR